MKAWKIERGIIAVTIIALAAVVFSTGCATTKTSTGTTQPNVIVSLVKSDIANGKVESHFKLLAMGAVFGCRLAKVDGYQHEFALVNAWATRVHTLLMAQTTPLTAEQMQSEAAAVGITTSDAIALEAVSDIISEAEKAFVSWGATQAEIYSFLVQASAGSAEGTQRFAGQ